MANNENSTDVKPDPNFSAPQPSGQHRWLSKLLGTWQSVTEAPAPPGKPPVRFEAEEVVRSLGGLWVIAESSGQIPGGSSATTIMTLGYDPVKGRFVGSFVATMMTHQWLYDGELEGGGSALVLNTEGPSMKGDGTSARYRDVITILDENRRTLTSNMLADDGQWTEVMTTTLTRIS